jgi:predicted oxidoreductase (fatty acid repression mutant protein)
VTFTESRALYNVEKYSSAGEDKYDNIVRNVRIAYWIPKATNTHSEYVMLIASTPKKKWVSYRALTLRL